MKRNPLVTLINMLNGICYLKDGHIHIEIPVRKFMEYMNTWEMMNNGKKKL